MISDRKHASLSLENDPVKRDIIFEMLLEILKMEGEITLSTFGNSMKPLISDGSSVRIRGNPIKQMKFGDVALLYSGKIRIRKMLIHRVIKIRRMVGHVQIFTKGDSSPRDLQYFTEKQYLGKVQFIKTEHEEFHLDTFFWRYINILIALLSSFQATFTYGFTIFRKKDFTHQILPQRLALSMIKRLVFLGKWVSKRKSFY